MAWYSIMTLIIVVGVGLTVYSRNEKNAVNNPPPVGPTATDHWSAALGIDICGTMQPSLTASKNLTTVGIRTFGNGLIDVNPGAVQNSSAFEGNNATLGLFSIEYAGFHLTNTSIQLPGTHSVKWKNGDSCTGPLHGKGTLVAKVWSSPTASPTLVTSNILGIHLTNGKMITLAFVPSGASIPEPPSKQTLIATMASIAKIGPIATTTTLPGASGVPSSTPTTTVPASTPTTSSASTTTVPSSTPTTTVPATTAPSGSSTGG